MKKNNRFLKKAIPAALLIVGMVFLILFVYYASRPEKYTLAIGDASPYDIVAQRSIRDKTETDLRAQKAAAEVAPVMLRSVATSDKVRFNVEAFFNEVDAIRVSATIPPAAEPGSTPAEVAAAQAAASQARQQAADKISLMASQYYQVILTADDALLLASLDEGRYVSIRGQAKTITSLVMSETLDTAQLQSSLSQKINNLRASLTYYQEDAAVVGRILALFLKPNVVFDEAATANARQAAYDRVQNNPVMIERGNRVVSQGDIITTENYQLLRSLDLLEDSQVSVQDLAGIAILVILATIIGVAYIRRFEDETFKQTRDRLALLLILLLPLLVSAYTTRISTLTPPIGFAAVLITAYFGFRTSMVLSLLLSLTVLPMTGFDPAFLMVAVSGSLVAALFTKGVTLKNNHAVIILTTSGAMMLTSLAYGLMMEQDWARITVDSGYAALSGALSVIAAIGIMPLFEMAFNAVSPLRLIELSQPGHPLLRRLFVEAPGSSQHSMMVANLADSAATAIGANAMLARVASYYHDIGKLESPMMFTENQEGVNPHDNMQPEQSAEIILAHPDAGVRLGRRYRLPPAILRIIHEHHGSTAQAYFYRKAKKLAEETGEPQPELEKYQYNNPIPTSRESAVVMLADSIEAAMKSTGITNLEDAEVLIRKIIKTKTDQDQLIQSGLSFRDVERIIQAILQVYAGHFHERIKYPDDEHSVSQPATAL
ncbi:MAG: HD family phosphohydrolase [Saccharofermentanales bacterium]|jgi:putative nucleotidyltransferase with HDIG domain